MTEQPTTPAEQPVTAAQLIAAHATYLRCVEAAVRQQRRSNGKPTRDVIADVPGAAELGQAALTVMAVATARFVVRVGNHLGIEPALLWRRFSADETAAVAGATQPYAAHAAPAEPGEEDTQP